MDNGNYKKHQQRCENYLKHTLDAYVFDPASGIHKPKSQQPLADHQRNALGASPNSPLFVSPRTDWHPVIFATLISFLVGIATLVLLAAYTLTTEQIYESSQATAIGTIQAAWAARDAADTANATLQEARKQGTDTHTLAVQAKTQSGLTRETIANVKQEFEQEHRPRIVVQGFNVFDFSADKSLGQEGEFVVGQPVEVGVGFKNIGKDTAYHVLIHAHVVFGKYTSLIKTEPADFDRIGDTLEPDAERGATPISILDPYSRETPKLDPSTIISWDGSEPIIVFGRVSYKDINGVLYCTPFALRKIPHNWLRNAAAGTLCPDGKR